MTITGRRDAGAIVSREAVATFWRDGVTVVRDAVDASVVAQLRNTVDDLVRRPRALHALNGEALPDSYLWLTEPACVDALVTSPLASIAALVLQASRVRLLYDQAFTKPCGGSRPTVWHQDLPYWPFAGTQIGSIWLALDDVDETTGGLRYLAGSHRWNKEYRPASALDPAAWADGIYDDPPDFDDPAFARCERRFDLRSGDVAIHHGLTVHSSSANQDPATDRRAWVTRWAGRDVRFHPRVGTGTFPLEVALGEGDELDHPLFPVLWDDEGLR